MIYLTANIWPLEIISLIFIFALKIHFYVKIKIRSTISNSFDFEKYYPGHDPEQHSRGFNHRLNTSRHANVGDIITFNTYNSKTTQ